MKKFVPVMALLLAILAFCGCSVEPKTLTDKGMSITLPGNFRVSEAEGYDVCFERNDCVVFALREAHDAADGFGDLTLKEYTELVLEANDLTEQMTETAKYNYFEFEKTVDGSDEPYSYLACCFRADEAFWLVQFSCMKSDYAKYRSEMLSWADTVTFSD